MRELNFLGICQKGYGALTRSSGGFKIWAPFTLVVCFPGKQDRLSSMATGF